MRTGLVVQEIRWRAGNQKEARVDMRALSHHTSANQIDSAPQVPACIGANVESALPDLANLIELKLRPSQSWFHGRSIQ
jgi:hypothetical protein